MGRKKAPAKAVWEQSIKELLAKHDLHPVEELIKMVQEQITLQPGDEAFVAGLTDDYEIVPGQHGKVLRPKFKHRKDIYSELAQYVSPKLRSTETKGQIDYNFNISFKRFDDDPPRVIDVTVKEVEDAKAT